MEPNQTINPLKIKTIYVALLTQTGTNDPTATVLQNTTGQTLTWTRDGAGYYIITSETTLFTENKTTVEIGPSQIARVTFATVLTDTENIMIINYKQDDTTKMLTAIDDLLLNNTITIKTYY